ncbi:MAG: MltA domain-containing protein, partial [Betaproteobacteria bacterium]|nr:MltA domain-containing protein [Betaproteobacteria bacterium]
MNVIRTNKKWHTWWLCALLAACAAPPKPPIAPLPQVVQPPVAPPPAPLFAVSKWEMLPDWQAHDLAPSWPALLQSCRVLKTKPNWQEVCANAEKLDTGQSGAEKSGAGDSTALRAFYETWFTPYQVFNPDGSEQGVITGYYEPKLYGSRTRTARYRYPLYAPPDDLLQIDLGEAYPQLKDLRLRGRLQGKRVVPYYNRAE